MGDPVKRLQVQFREPYTVEVVESEVPEPGPEQVRVRTIVSAISPGTELLAYRGELPEYSVDDDGIDPLSNGRSYPMQTGYCAVGRIECLGAGVDRNWAGRTVFVFGSHGTHFVADPSTLIELPDAVSPELATFIPNLETAAGLVMDSRPVLGERVVVIGQGIVGLLVTRLLSRFPLDTLITLDRIPERRERSLLSGARYALDPGNREDRETATEILRDYPDPAGADLIFELSGNPAALNDAIELAGYGGRIVAGSWYGSKSASLNLGGRFHRNRISITSSQVSTVAPELSARWTKQRRMRRVLSLLNELGLENFITHRYPVRQAAQAYALLDENPGETVQVIFQYPDET